MFVEGAYMLFLDANLLHYMYAFNGQIPKNISSPVIWHMSQGCSARLMVEERAMMHLIGCILNAHSYIWPRLVWV